MRGLLIVGAVSLALGLAAGCEDSLKQGLNLNSEAVWGPPPNKQVEMTFDPNDADKRREGIVLLSSKPWGVKEPYLKGYATILKNDDNDNVRAAALNALGKAGDAVYLADISTALSDPSAKVRWAAADVLGMPAFAKTNDPHLLVVVARLRDHAKDDKSADVRAACAKALHNHTADNVVETLIDCLEDKEFGVRWQAHDSLCGISGVDRGYEPTEWLDYLAKRGNRSAPVARSANSAPKRLGDLLLHDGDTPTTNPYAPAGDRTAGGAK